MFVDNFGMSRVVVVVVVSGCEERFEVCHEEERLCVAFSRLRIPTYNSRGRDTGLVETGVGDRKECGFRERTEWRTSGDSCCIRT